MFKNDFNILLNQIIKDGSSSFHFKEIIPKNYDPNQKQYLSIEKNDIGWVKLDLSLNIIVDNKLINTNIYYADKRIGLDRFPMHNYKVDIATPKDTIVTALHIGDGSFGFSMGNGTSKGFIPEIIGVGSDEDDAGLYFIGIAGNNIPSETPLIAIDGRNTYNGKLLNRPIFGVTSANYNEYSLLIDQFDNLKLKGNISLKDVILNKISLIDILKDLQRQIDDLKAKIR